MAQMPTAGYDMSVGKIRIRRGYFPVKDHTGKELTKHYLFSWDVVPHCSDTNCPATKLCDYPRDTGKCQVTASYLRAAAQTIFQNFSEVLDEPTLYRVGIHLMPAYRTLCRLKIEELGIARVISVSAQGKPTANPIFREIRETIKLIEMLWEKLGLSQYQVVPPEMDTVPSLTNPDKSSPAAPEPKSYYSRLEAGLVKTKSQLAEEEATKPETSVIQKPRLLLRRKK
jgi:hypothetical protein